MSDQEGGGKNKAAEKVYYRVCPECGTRNAESRHWCDCHTALRDDEISVAAADDPLRIEPEPNVESPIFNCRDCGGGCKPCYMFGRPVTRNGWGGAGCTHRRDGDLRCTCCEGVRALMEPRLDAADKAIAMLAVSFGKPRDHDDSGAATAAAPKEESMYERQRRAARAAYEYWSDYEERRYAAHRTAAT